MTVIIIILLFFLSNRCSLINSQATLCGEFPSEYKNNPTSEVAGGYEADGPWPWLVWLVVRMKGPDGKISPADCAATIIDSKHLLSASHCFLPDPRHPYDNLYEVEARFNVFDQSNEKEKNRFSMTIGPKQVKTHKEFSFNKEPDGMNDIAILELPDRLNFAGDKKETLTRRVCLPSNDPIVTRRQGINENFCKIVGWGNTDEKMRGGKEVSKLREGDVFVLPDRRCQRMFEMDDKIQLCAGRPRDEDQKQQVSSCHGDSGGGLFCQSRLGQWYLIGIVSAGSECGFFGKPAKFVRVRSFLDWIDFHSQNVHNYGIDEKKNFKNKIFRSLDEKETKQDKSNDDDYDDDRITKKNRQVKLLNGGPNEKLPKREWWQPLINKKRIPYSSTPAP